MVPRDLGERPAGLREQVALGRRLGLAQFETKDYTAAFGTFTRALGFAETLSDKILIASANYWIAETLAHNNAADASLGRFRKSFELWREIVGAKDTASGADPSAYENALEKLSTAATAEAAARIKADLAAFGWISGRP